MITTRTLARHIGLNRFLGNLLPHRDYEAAFDTAMFKHISTGDQVWDIGANVGYYTTKFSEKVGVNGRVVAFEPFPKTFTKLSEKVSKLSNVQVVSWGIGQENATLKMMDAGDGNGVTNRIVDDEEVLGVHVKVTTADDAMSMLGLPVPNVVKIDTEGFELDVIVGMGNLLLKPELRAVFIEIHFSLLNERGLPFAPATIERLLLESGFNVNWTDASHIAAIRDFSNA